MSLLGQNTGINRRAVGMCSSSTLKATQNSDNSHQELTCAPPALGSTIGHRLWRLEPWPLWRAKGTWTCGCIWAEQEEQLSVPAQAACWRQPRSLFAADINWESNTGSSLLQFFPPLGWRSQGWERTKPSQREQNHSGPAPRAFPPAAWDQVQFSSVQFSHSVMSDSLWPHRLQHARPPCPSPTPGVYSNSCPLSQWCHPTISASVVPFSSCPQYFPASESFPMSLFFTSGGQSTGVSASASVLPMNIQD